MRCPHRPLADAQHPPHDELCAMPVHLVPGDSTLLARASNHAQRVALSTTKYRGPKVCNEAPEVERRRLIVSGFPAQGETDTRSTLGADASYRIRKQGAGHVQVARIHTSSD